MRFCPLYPALLAGLATPVVPALAADAPRELDAVVVIGQREPAPRTRLSNAPDALPSAGATITAREIDGMNITRDISQVFRRIPGVMANNVDQGDTGNGFRMRGFATQGSHGADVAVYVDGVPQNVPSPQAGAGHGPAYLEWLSPAMIEHITVVKGPVSALYGDQNRAGAVDMRTRSGGDGPSSISATVESHDGRRLTLDASQRWGDIDALLVADRYRAGSFRRDARQHRDNLLFKLGRRMGDGDYSVRINHYDSDFTTAGFLLLDDLQAGRVDPRSSQFGLPGHGGGQRTGVVVERRQVEEAGWSAVAYAEDFERVRAVSNSAVQHTVGSDDRNVAGARAMHTWQGDAHLLTLGADARHDRGDAMRRIWRNGEPTSNYTNNHALDLLTYGAFVQAQYRPLETVKLTGGLRHDWFDYEIVNRKLPAASTRYRAKVMTPKLGAAWQITPRIEAYANVAQGFRSPAAEQISSSGSTGPLGAPGGRVFEIEPTKVTSHDLGFSAQAGAGWTLGVVGYRVRNEDEIVNLPDGSVRAMGQTTRAGYDVEGRWTPAPDTTLYASYGRVTMARADNPLPNQGARISVPETLAKAGASHGWDAGAGRLRLGADAFVLRRLPFYVGAPQTTLAFLPTYTRYDLRLSYDVRDWQLAVFATLQPHEATSEAAYSTAAGILLAPQPRTHVGTTIRYRF